MQSSFCTSLIALHKISFRTEFFRLKVLANIGDLTEISSNVIFHRKYHILHIFRFLSQTNFNIESPLKLMKNASYFILALFVVNIFKFFF